MTVQEAIRSKRLFKRQLMIKWLEVDETSLEIYIQGTKTRVLFNAHDLLAQDWEVARPSAVVFPFPNARPVPEVDKSK